MDDIKLATVNDIPGSCGPWKTHYDARQKVYNAQLIAGVGILISTIAYVCIKFMLPRIMLTVSDYKILFL
ncbi:hypothetical protein ALC60_09378 [Trachymyrmex zeteki]|uniref:Deltamethrin resistance protein prag01 domain-containing protein n=1 Tax=Mycetomoellerius zeteki TaxID=64791 RepID=A0A151WV27_9HYME|nr:hypothetical protein ALC60_09378 [Trachymyrmex zeteki]